MEGLPQELPNPFAYFLPIFLLLIALEIWLAHRNDEPLYAWKESWSSAWVGLGAALINTLTKAYQIAFFWLCYEWMAPFREQYLGYENLGWAWWVWALCVLGDDFSFYWHHRLCHNVRLLWAAHIVHHSGERFNLINGVRNSWSIFFYKPLYWFWLPMLGFHPLMVGLCMSVNSIYQFFLHTPYVRDTGWLGKLFNTPWVHQVHHASNVEYLDKNHGGMFIFWDKIFGTFQDNRSDIQVQFGVRVPPPAHDPVTLNFHEFADIWRDVRRTSNWGDKWRYVFYPPGWSPDGSTKTAKQLQADCLESVDGLEARVSK